MCRQASSKSFAKASARRKKNGLCVFCETETWGARTTCRPHTLKLRASSSAHYLRHKRRINSDPARKKRMNAWKRHAVRTKPRARFLNAKGQAKGRGLSWALSEKAYCELIALPCHYCELPNNVEMSIGLDRLDNEKGYVKNNVVSCCRECNVVRGRRFAPDEMMLIGAVIRKIKLKRAKDGVQVDSRGLKGWR